MTGLGIVIPRDGLGPPIDPLPSAGVDGYTHRYAAVRLDLEHGDTVTTWSDEGSVPDPMVSSTGGVLLDTTTGPYPFVTLGPSIAAGINNASNETHPFSFAIVAKKTTTNSTLYTAGGATVSRAGDGTYQLAIGGSFLNVAGSADWECIVGTCHSAGETSRLSVGAATATGVRTPSATAVSQLVRGGAGNSSSVVDLVVWSGVALDASQHTAVLAAMQAAYPALAL